MNYRLSRLRLRNKSTFNSQHSTLFFFIKVSSVNPYHTSQENERHGGHGHHTVVDVACVVNALRDDLEAEERATTEKFAQTAYYNEDVGIAQTVAHTVEERRPRLVLHSERLKTTHEDTVGDDKTYVYRELYAHVVDERLPHLAYDGNKSCNHYQPPDDTDAVRDCVADD